MWAVSIKLPPIWSLKKLTNTTSNFYVSYKSYLLTLHQEIIIAIIQSYTTSKFEIETKLNCIEETGFYSGLNTILLPQLQRFEN